MTYPTSSDVGWIGQYIIKSNPYLRMVAAGFAICLEIVGAIGLRFSESFTLLLPTTLALAAFTMALYLACQ